MQLLGKTSLAVATLLCWACASDSSTGTPSGHGQLVVRLKDAPFPTDQVSTVDMFVMRVDARAASTTDADAEDDVDAASAASQGWSTVAEPNESIDLLALTGSNLATLGTATLAAGTYQSLRLILDVSQSSITLKDGTTLSGTSDPGIVFPSAAHTGIKILLDTPITIDDGGTTTVVVDFDVSNSFVMRGNTILQNGLLFKPVIHATLEQ